MKKKRIVVKIGSSSLTNAQGEIDQVMFDDHIHAVAALREAGHEVLLVSSGAVAAGFAKLGYGSRPITLKGRQAAAAVGQGLLIQSYIDKFSEFSIMPAQILLTRDDFTNRERYRNAYATIMELLERRMLPIINENDTVSVRELTFGDNDMLSSLVSGFIRADQLIILTDINGLYDANPRDNPNAKKFDYLEEITDEMLGFTKGTGSKVGTGGMKSKLLAAKTALSVGVPVFIGRGSGTNKLIEILEGNGDGTYISNKTRNNINISQQWIAMHSESSGKIYVDQGAEEAILFNSKNLLPAGIFKVQGSFQKGDVVEVFGMNGLIGKGEVTYSSTDLADVIGKRSEERGRRAGATQVEVIHRDKWVRI
ncbi:glutamate 5-kinase [Sporosarcina sp. G11-34]|uniref:glutamate 5-kinase n=1 Tax=Sporosarcina sp. G11-34 TaxID=2849605 RepID=UPI0022A9136D|nr:glutamate 5-kinase [Sporosarcina sp. G11-34]MCZ2257862.1 glutamate 5-kinase [Sporosarcina sp. G11-34]